MASLPVLFEMPTSCGFAAGGFSFDGIFVTIMCKRKAYAAVVQWIGLFFPKESIWVRLPAGAQKSKKYNSRETFRNRGCEFVTIYRP